MGGILHFFVKQGIFILHSHPRVAEALAEAQAKKK